MGRFDGVLLASDFDDTLVNRNRQVPERTKRALEEFTREGGRFTIASGRGVEAVERQLGDLPVNAPVVAADGTQIFDFSSGEMRYEARLPDSAAADFAAILQKYATTAVEIYACGKNYCVNPNQVTEEHLKIVGITAEPSSLREIPRPWVYAKFEDDRPVLEQIQAEFLSKFPGYETFFSHRYLLEVAPAGVHKGSGVLELARLLGISGAHVYCAGDNENDLSMLRIARTAFVPAHSTPAALAAADVVVCDCDEGAIADVVEYLKGRYERI